MPIVPVFPPSGGGSPPGPATPQWLDIPAGVTAANNSVPATQPGEFVLNLPTNASGNTYYRIEVVSRGQSGIQPQLTDNTTRTVRWNEQTISSSTSNMPLVIRAEVTDDAGNFGIGYHILAYWTGVLSRVQVLPEIVLEPNDPEFSYTFTPFEAGAVGSDVTTFVGCVGTGSIRGPHTINQRISTRVIQGPFIVNVPQGGTLFMITIQEPGSLTGANHWVIQPIRKKMPNGLQLYGGWNQGYESDLTGWDNSSLTNPIVSPQNASINTPSGVPGFYDKGTVYSAILTGGGAATFEKCNMVAAQGLHVELQSTASNARAIIGGLKFQLTDNVNSGREPAYSNVIPTADEVVTRVYGRMDMTVANTSNQGFIDWFAYGTTAGLNTTGISGLRFTVNPGVYGGMNTSDYVRVSVYSSAASQGQRGLMLKSDVLGRDMGMDVYLRGGAFVIVLYQWQGDWPDLDAKLPYAGIRHWMFEHWNIISGVFASGSPNYLAAGQPPYNTNIANSNNHLAQCNVNTTVSLGNNGAATMVSKLKGIQVLHRPRHLIHGV